MSRHASSAVWKFTLPRFRVTQLLPEQNGLQAPVDFTQNPHFKESRMQTDGKIFQIFMVILFAATNAAQMLAVDVLRIDCYSSRELLRAQEAGTALRTKTLKDRKEKR